MNKISNYVIIGLVLLMIGSFMADRSSTGARATSEVSYSDFMDMVKAGSVGQVVLDEGERVIIGAVSYTHLTLPTTSRV